MECASRAHFDEFADFVPMPGLVLQEGQNQELRAALLPGLLHFCPHICASPIWYAAGPPEISRLPLFFGRYLDGARRTFYSSRSVLAGSILAILRVGSRVARSVMTRSVNTTNRLVVIS